MRLLSAALSHKGLVRRGNEDAFVEHPAAGVWAVCDGMGGHADGAVASGLVARSLAGIAPPASGQALLACVRAVLDQCNRSLTARANGDISGTTAAILLTHGRHYAGLWVGDSRLYLLRRGRLSRLTTDHSWAQEQMDAGRLTTAEAAASPYANMLTRAIGAADGVTPDLCHGAMEPGDLFLLCSDGLTRLVPDEEMAGLLVPAGDLAGLAARLLALCLERGAPDNVTVVLVTATENDATTERVTLD